MSQHASADTSRQKTVDIVASTTDPGTTYDTTVFKGGVQHSFSNANTHTIANYGTNSPSTAGDSFTAQLLGTGDHSIELSPMSAAEIVKIDSVIPVASVSTTDNWATMDDASTDALSGVDEVYAYFAPTGDPAPTFSASDPNWKLVSGNTTTNLSPGYYDVYAYAIDNATNKSGVTSVATNQLVTSSDPARISATYVDDNSVTQNYASGTWINKDINVEVSEPTGFSSIINWYGAIYQGATVPPAAPDYKATTADSAVDHTYTTDTPTPGISVKGYVVDASDVNLSAVSPSITLLIDKSAPTGALDLNTGTWRFIDQSTDQPTLSGVDATKTKLAIVPAGAAQPAASAYINIADTAAELPATGHHDVWVIATDIAGNESTPTKTLSNISRSGKDQIGAEDFMRGLNEGAMNDVDAKALGVAWGIYYGGTDVLFNDMVVDATELAAINTAIGAGTKGVFPLTFETPAVNPHLPIGDPLLPTTATITIQVTLTDEGDVNVNVPDDPDDNSERIYGNNFYYGIDNGALQKDPAKYFASVAAFDTDNAVMSLNLVDVDQTELDVINAAIAAKDKSGNPFPLTFTTPDGTSVTVDVTLFDAGSPPPPGPNEPVIGANDFAYGCDEPDLTDVISKQLSSVAAKDGFGNDAALAAISVNATQLADIVAGQNAGIEGPYPLTFEYMGKTAEITVTLRSHGNQGVDHITANDFSYGLDEVSITDVIAKIRSSVAATDPTNTPIPLANISVDNTELAAIQAAHTAGVKGQHPLTFETASGTSVTVTVTLYDHSTPGTGSEYIAANDFSYGCDETALTDVISKILSSVNGRDENGYPVSVSDITVDATELAAIVAAQADNNAGPYPLTFSLPSGTSVTVKVTLKHHGGGTPGGSDHISANDFGYGIDEPNDISDNDAKLLAHVEAVDKDILPIDLSNITVDQTELQAINDAKNAGIIGPYPLTFSTPDGTSVTVTVTLKDHGSGTPGASEHITANDFGYGVDEEDLKECIAKVLSDVSAEDINGDPINIDNISVDSTELAAIVAAQHAGRCGKYPLTFSTPDGTSVTVMVTLRHTGTGEPGGCDHIVANNFIYGISEGNIDDNAAKARGGVIGVDKNGKKIAVSNISVDQGLRGAINDSINAAKVQDLPLSYLTPDNTAENITVFLRDNAAAPDPNNGKGAIGANDFKHNNNDGALTEDEARDLADAIAKDEHGNLFPRGDLKVDAGELAAINKAIEANQSVTLPLTFTAPDGQKVTVMVTLVAGDVTGVKTTGATTRRTVKPPRTNDATMDVYLWLIVAVAAGAAVLVVAMKKKHKKQH